MCYVEFAMNIWGFMVMFNRKHQLYEDMYRCQYNMSGIYQRIGNLGHAIRFVDMAIKCASVNMKDKLAEKEALMLKTKVVSQVLIGIIICLNTFSMSRLCGCLSSFINFMCCY